MTRTSFLALFLLALTAGCGITHVEAGHVGVEINSCSGGGVKDAPVPIGYHFTTACTSIVEYPTYVQTAVWTKSPSEGHPSNEEVTFTNADKMSIAVDVNLAYQLDPQKVPAFYAKFRDDELDGFTHGFLRNLARDKFNEAAGRYHIDQIMGDNAAFLKDVRSALQEDLNPYGVILSQFGFVGAPRPPQAVIDQINATTQAMQKGLQIDNELKQSEATARKQVATAEGDAKSMRLRADAEAYANEKLSKSLSPALIEYLRTQKWDGKLPQVQGQAGGTLLNLGGR